MKDGGQTISCYLKGQSVSKNLSNYVVHLSPNEMEKWGRKFGYNAEEIFAVDSRIEDGYETSIGSGYHGTPQSKKFSVIYRTTVSIELNPLTNKSEMVVKFHLDSRFVNGKREYFREAHKKEYAYFVSRRTYFRDAFDKFLRDIIKDGYLTFKELVQRGK